jgi:hypothetical protein
VSAPPPTIDIFHITHVSNLPGIIANGALVSDALMIARGGPATSIGMSNIKRRRLSLSIGCHQGLNVGDCVPFYFCPRSVMLFQLHCANAPGLTYLGGQGPIVHLRGDLHAVVGWANGLSRRWAFSHMNAAANYTAFFKSLSDLNQVDWDAVRSTDFRPGSTSPSGNPVKEMKAAEFLVEGDFPWPLVQQIGVASQSVASQVHAALAATAHKPRVSVEPSWYF